MKKIIVNAVVIVSIWCIGSAAFAQKAGASNIGETKFKALCAICHPDGGNIVNPKKTLHKKDREENSVQTEADIVKIMRKPGPGMTPFDEKTVPSQEAQEIAKYILKTFK